MDKKIIVIFGLGLIAGFGGFYLFQSKDALSQEKVGKVAMDFINKAVEKDNVTASFMNINEESGVYKIHLKIAEQEYDSFVSKDGKYLFSSAFNLGAANQETQAISESPEASQLENLAKCVTEKGAKFYGASWCSYCNNQKEMFGEAAQYLPYIECSAGEGKDQLDVCKNNNVTSYPTWEFADGSRETGELSAEKLAEKTGCQL